MSRDNTEPIDVIISDIIKSFLIVIAVLGLVVIYVVKNYTPTVTNTEYFEDNNCSVTKVYCIKGVDYVNVYSECGDISVQNSDYYRYYTNRIGDTVTAKFERTYYSDGSVHLKLYEITPNE